MRLGLMVCGLAGLLLSGCEQSAPPKGKRGKSEEWAAKEKQLAPFKSEVRLEKLTLTAPEGWGRKPVQSTFIIAEFVLPRAEGDNLDGRLTLSVAGGDIEANIDRWKDQFGGKPEKSHRENLKVNDLPVTLVDFSGEFNDQRGPTGPTVKRADFRMIAAIISSEGQLHFVKAVGPKKTMESHADKIMAFIRSTK